MHTTTCSIYRPRILVAMLETHGIPAELVANDEGKTVIHLLHPELDEWIELPATLESVRGFLGY